jgi:VIT1/CCC1 family predicted Fe2+/Mn2+ transporter
LGYVAARLGGWSRKQSIFRMVVLGAGTMGATIVLGRLVGGAL